MTPSQNTSNLTWTLLFLCWLTAMIATLGSLFFSEVMLFPPCVMCWYQRICMYPLAIIFLVALLSNDKNVFKYAMPLVLLGLFFAIYQNLLYYGILPEAAAPCSQGVSCTSDYINWFGFITIQLLSLVSFVTVFTLLIFLKRKAS
ncbi:disulfide oxidoreductase [Sulfurospirillum oryzae]|uniref:disulfide oxidoreductase n=1 Tax=Sulfurospirillum oryzae TaxID=2976535 RepID=UPI0021E77D96|nr:disulfide oxidoreductase [Sulfurospirillum oryzae]